jgi:hypothetical protein
MLKIGLLFAFKNVILEGKNIETGGDVMKLTITGA